jgi:integrase
VKKLIRKTWPKIRHVVIKGEPFFRVDARKTGTDGKQETFKLRAEAEARALEIERQFAASGTEGLTFPAELRGMALTAQKLLEPFGKSIVQAAEFYRTHLEETQKRRDSALVSTLATAWHAEKESGKHRKLRSDTIRGIRQTSELLAKAFGQRRILEVTTSDLRQCIDALDAGLRRKFNLRSMISQFFNWCIALGHLEKNPATPIKIHMTIKEVTIFKPGEALRLLKECEAEFKDLILYHVISLFAGLRPNECKLLKWEEIHLEENTITVLAETSKTKETRNVPIEPTLRAWIDAYKPAILNGSIIPHRNFTKRAQALHAALGFKGQGQNPTAPEWPQDIMRHSYGSYWLAKFKQRAVLAEHMGNTVEMIKKHYKRVVSKADCAEYWRIVPGYDGKTMPLHVPTDEEIDAARVNRIQKVLAGD